MTVTQILPDVIVSDISHWDPQSEQNIEIAVKAGLVGNIVKYTQGLFGADPAAIQNMWDTYEGGVKLMGGYHFGTSADPIAQAEFFLDSIKTDFAGELDGILLMLDLEANGDSTMSVKQAEAFVQFVHNEVGRWPVLYMGRDGPDGKRSDLPSTILSNCDLMLPAYGTHPDLSLILPPEFRVPSSDTDRGGCIRLHQFTDGKINGGPFPGLGVVDQSRFVGFSSLEAATAWWGR